MSVLKTTLSAPPCAADLTREGENERSRLRGRHAGLGSQGGVNQQAGLIIASTAGFFFFSVSPAGKQA